MLTRSTTIYYIFVNTYSFQYLTDFVSQISPKENLFAQQEAIAMARREIIIEKQGHVLQYLACAYGIILKACTAYIALKTTIVVYNVCVYNSSLKVGQDIHIKTNV